jgi:outer membrane protein assembly factor BamE (lipoprotein component of BamABCDE complex)
MKKKLTLFVISILFVNLIGCAATLSGKKFNHSAVPQIEKGKNSQEDIRKLFGEPLTVRKTETGEIWNYFYSASELGGLTNPSRSLDIYFDKSGKVMDYKYKVD